MHCPACGLILGKSVPDEASTCPRCGRVLRVFALAVEDGFEKPRLVPVDGTERRIAATFLSEPKLRFLIAERTTRPAAWEPLIIELEEARLAAFARSMGWALASLNRDRGPANRDADRPFSRLRCDLELGAVNTVLVSDFNRVPRKDLHALAEMARVAGAEVVATSPHRADDNLILDDIDYDSIAESWGDNRALARLWSRSASDAVKHLIGAAGWHWTTYAADAVGRVLGPEAIRAWREADSACRDRPWKDVLTRFAVVRARRSGLLDGLPVPALATCVQCRERFLGSALPARLMELSVGRPPCCRKCLGRAFCYREEAGFAQPTEIDDATAEELAAGFFRGLPQTQYQRFVATALEMQEQARARGVVHPAPSTLWLQALTAAGLLGELGVVMQIESFFRAEDGHLSTSLGVALLDNWLHRAGLQHRPDVRYPGGGEASPPRADFQVDGVFVEFLGMRGGDELHKDVGVRLELARVAGAHVAGIFAEDLVVPGVVRQKVRRWIATPE